MHYFSEASIAELETRYRNNLINSISGYKSANLIGSISKQGITNLAVFNSVVHLGSNPALLGFILRPTTVPKTQLFEYESNGSFYSKPYC